MKKIVRYAVAVCAAVATGLCASAFALPGIQSRLPDVSGEYAIYRDYTFEEPTYVGFLCYDDETYGAVKLTPSLGGNTAVLFTLDASSDVVDITGERILSDAAPDVDAVNYIHDMLYELTARRAAVNGSDFSEAVISAESFPQFGGDVVMEYAYYVPLFNLNRITSADGNAVFELVRMGQIEADNDGDFYGFTDLPDPFSFEDRSFPLDPKAFPEVYELDEQVIRLDSQWMMQAGNVWFLDDAAMFWLDSILVNPEFNERNDYLPQEYFVRRFSLSTPGRYAVLPEMSIEKLDGGVFRLSNLFYNPETNEATRDIKVFIPVKGNIVTTKTLTVFESIYQANKAYFDGITAR